MRTGTPPQIRAAFLDFIPKSGWVYTPSVEMSVQDITAGDGFLAMGFSANTLQANTYSTAKEVWDAGKDGAYASGEYTGPLNVPLFHNQNQKILASAPFEGFSAQTEQAFAVLDLTGAYAGPGLLRLNER